MTRVSARRIGEDAGEVSPRAQKPNVAVRVWGSLLLVVEDKLSSDARSGPTRSGLCADVELNPAMPFFAVPSVRSGGVAPRSPGAAHNLAQFDPGYSPRLPNGSFAMAPHQQPWINPK